MKLTAYSKNRFYKTFSDYEVPKEWADVMFNYLVHGFPPGSFFTALLANDAMNMLGHSHPSNTIPALKNLAVWIQNYIYYADRNNVAAGSYAIVDDWIKMSTSQRRAFLERRVLVYTEQEEIMMVLKGEKTIEPFFF